MKTIIAYHAVTERPLLPGQVILMDAEHQNGVGRRVAEKLPLVERIYRNPAAYRADGLEHHTAVTLRELAMEEVRRAKYPQYPSRMACLYVSRTLEEAEKWADFFARIGRPTYAVVKLEITGRCFIGDAERCFPGSPDRVENIRLAEKYWAYPQNGSGNAAVCEMLADGEIRVLETVKEINANL